MENANAITTYFLVLVDKIVIKQDNSIDSVIIFRKTPSSYQIKELEKVLCLEIKNNQPIISFCIAATTPEIKNNGKDLDLRDGFVQLKESTDSKDNFSIEHYFLELEKKLEQNLTAAEQKSKRQPETAASEPDQETNEYEFEGDDADDNENFIENQDISPDYTITYKFAEDNFIWILYNDFIYKTKKDFTEQITTKTSFLKSFFEAHNHDDLIQECYFAYGMEQLKKKIMESISAISFTSNGNGETVITALPNEDPKEQIEVALLRENLTAISKFRFDKKGSSKLEDLDKESEFYKAVKNIDNSVIKNLEIFGESADLIQQYKTKFNDCIKLTTAKEIIDCVLSCANAKEIYAEIYEQNVNAQLIQYEQNETYTARPKIQDYIKKKQSEQGSTISLYGGVKMQNTEAMSQNVIVKNNLIIKQFLNTNMMRFLLLISPDYIRKRDDGTIVIQFVDFFNLIFSKSQIKDLLRFLFIDYNFIDLEKFQTYHNGYEDLGNAIDVYKKYFLVNGVNEKTTFADSDSNTKVNYYNYYAAKATGINDIKNEYTKIIHVADLIAIYDYWVAKNNLKNNDTQNPNDALQIVSLALTNYYTLLNGGKISKTFTHPQNEIWKEIAGTADRKNTGNLKKFDTFRNPRKTFNMEEERKIMNTDRIMTILKLNAYKKGPQDGSLIKENLSYETEITTNNDFFGLSVAQNADPKLNNIITSTPGINPVHMRFGGFTRIFQKQQSLGRDEIEEMTEDAATGKIIQDKIKNGKNVFIFGYGASGSGKTTMLIYNTYSHKYGFVIMLCKNIIEKLGSEFRVKVTFKELYMGKDIAKEETLVFYSISEFDALAKLITQRITVNRKISFTLNNSESSRSHVLCFLKFVDSSGNEPSEKIGTLIVADLAGVENSFNETDCDTLIAMSADKKIEEYVAPVYKKEDTISLSGTTENMKAHINTLTNNDNFIYVTDNNMSINPPGKAQNTKYVAKPEPKKNWNDCTENKNINYNNKNMTFEHKLEGETALNFLRKIGLITKTGQVTSDNYIINESYRYRKIGTHENRTIYLQENIFNEISVSQYIKDLEKWNLKKKYELPFQFTDEMNVEQIQKHVDDITGSQTTTKQINIEGKLKKSEEIMSLMLKAVEKTKLRKKEGEFINKDLELLREDLFTSMIEKSHGMLFTAPNIEDNCLSSFCSETVSTCFMMKKTPKKPNSHTSLIIKTLVDVLKSASLPEEDVLKSLNIVLFTVFNTSQRGDVASYHEPIQYIDISPLKKYLYVDKKLDRAGKEIDFICKLFTHENPHTSIDKSPLRNHTNFLLLINEWNHDQENFIEQFVPDFIRFIDNHNASTPIGTLVFTDNLAKFGIDRGVCVDQDKIQKQEAAAAAATATAAKADAKAAATAAATAKEAAAATAAAATAKEAATAAAAAATAAAEAKSATAAKPKVQISSGVMSMADRRKNTQNNKAKINGR